MPAAPHLPGFRDLTPLGRGGYSEVFRAYQEQFDRWVAVKVLTFSLGDDRAQRRFLRECQVAGRVSAHPHIVTVYDAGLAPDGRPYIAMELYEGGSVADRLRADGPLDVGETLRIGVALAGALESAHRAGIVHRDVKPGNVLLTAYGHPALTDFGLSVLAEHQEITAGTDALSPYHAPPEVLERAKPTPVSDVYSLGSTTYTMVAGRPPHQMEEGEALASLLTRIVQADVPPIDRSDIPRALDAALAGALARDPAVRTPTALAFAQALQQAQTELGGEVTQPIVIDPPAGVDVPPGDLPLAAEPPTPMAFPPAAEPPTPAAVPPAPVLEAGALGAAGALGGLGATSAEGTALAPAGPPPPGDETVHRSRMQWPPPPRQSEPKKSRKGPLLIAAAVLAVVAIGAAVFVATNGDDETARSSDTTETTETTESTTTTTEATTTTESTTTTTAPSTTTTTAAPTTTTTAAGPPRALPIARVAVPATAANANDACGDSTSYGAGNLTDGNSQTAWRMDGDGSGEWLTIVLDGPHRIRSVGLVPGYAKVDPCDGTNRFAENRRPTAVTWQFEDGTTTPQRLRDAGEMQTVSVDARASIIRVRLDGVTGNPGRDYTAVSEIAVTGN